MASPENNTQITDRNEKLTRILCIDGGGIRGIVPAQILVALEKKLRIATNDPQTRIGSYFDMIAGTSTGGILTCFYLMPDKLNPSKPLYKAEDAVDFYMQQGGDIFSIPFTHKIRTMGGLTDEKFPVQNLEKALLNAFGKTKLHELIKPCLVTAFDVFEGKAHFFRQHEALLNEGDDYFLTDVTRATSAAPTYFESPLVQSMSGVTRPLIDGGVFANNPAMCAYAEARKMKFSPKKQNPTAKDMLLVSIGNIGTLKMGFPHNKVKNWGIIEWIKPLIDIMMSGVSQTVHYQLLQLFKAEDVIKQYVRIDPELYTAKADMDDASPRNLAALKEAGTRASELDEIQDKLDRVVKLLISEQPIPF